jgi:FMN-dependent NADH-azoreductase
LGFLGLTDVQFVHAENQTRDPKTAAEGVAKAEAELAALNA